MSRDAAEARPERRRLDVATRRAALLAAASRLLAEAAPHEVTMADVAREAGASEALVHHYFGNRAGLHVALAQEWEESLARRLAEVDAALHPQAKARQRLVAAIETYAEVIAQAPAIWAWPVSAPDSGPTQALAVRMRARAQRLSGLRDVLGLPVAPPPPPDAGAAQARQADYALEGFLGFVDSACAAWVAAGYPDGDRQGIAEAAVNALEAALVRLGYPDALQRPR